MVEHASAANASGLCVVGSLQPSGQRRSLRALAVLRAARASKAHSTDVVAKLLGAAFDKQREFILDPCRLKAALCSRRAGKSAAGGIYLLKEAFENPGTLSLFACLTRARAKSIMWEGQTGLKWLNNRLALGLTADNFNETELTVRLPNGSQIRLFGLDADKRQRDKVLGDPYRLVIVDEAASFTTDLRKLVKFGLQPAMADHRGTICLTGTPGDFVGPPGEGRHFFYAVTNGEEDGWETHTWNTFDNPHMASKWAADLEEIKKKNPLYCETADFKMMWLGEWAVDFSKLVYRFNADRNVIDSPPDDLIGHVISVDLGWEDATSFTAAGWRNEDPTLYILRSYKQRKLNFDQVADEIESLRRTYPGRIVVDGANKQGVEHMRDTRGLPLEAAEKAGKADFIRQMNTDLVTARIKCVAGMCDDLIAEWGTLRWDESARERRELAIDENHCADGALYGWRMSRHFWSRPTEQPKKKTAEEQMDDYFERERARLSGEDEYD